MTAIWTGPIEIQELARAQSSRVEERDGTEERRCEGKWRGIADEADLI